MRDLVSYYTTYILTRSGTVTLQTQDAPLPIHGVKRLPQIEKNSVEGLQLEVRELLRQLGLNNRCPHAAFVVAAVKAVMQIKRVQPMIDDCSITFQMGSNSPMPR